MVTEIRSRQGLALFLICVGTFIVYHGRGFGDSGPRESATLRTVDIDLLERKVVREIRKLGGSVEYGTGKSKAHVVNACFTPEKALHMQLLRNLPQLKRLILSGELMGQDHFLQASKLSNIESLTIYVNTSPPYPNSLPKDGLKYLNRLTNLKEVVLAEFSDLTDGEVQWLANLPKLEVLGLYDTYVTAAALQKLVVLKKLRRLSLAGIGIRDASLEGVKKIKNLAELELSGTAVTELEKLRGMGNLRILEVHYHWLSEDALVAFKRARPDVDIRK